MSSHAPRVGQPSAMARTFACPGWVARSAGLENPTSPWADQGTAAHALAAFCLRHGYAPLRFLGHKIDVSQLDKSWSMWLLDGPDHEGVVIDEDMVDAVALYVDTCRAAIEPGDLFWVETRVNCAAYHELVHGTADFGRFRPSTGELVILDFKYGVKYAVTPEDNPQPYCYALGACFIPEVYGQVQWVVVGICQPRGVGEPLQWHGLTANDLYQWGYRMAEAVTLAQAATVADTVAGEHCTFCPAFGVCETAARLANEFYGDTTGSELAPFTSPETYDLVKLARALALAPFARQWATAVERFAAHQAERGIMPPGWKLKETTGHRKWRSEAAVYRWAEENEVAKYRLTQPVKIKSPAMLEKDLGVRYQDFIVDLWEKPRTGSKLVPIDTDVIEKAANINLEFQARPDVIGDNTQ